MMALKVKSSFKKGIHVSYEYKPAAFAASVATMKDPVALAASGAMKEAGDIFKTRVRADMAAAGFKRKFLNSFRVNVYPAPPKVSINAAALGFSKVPYAGVFEEPTNISGRPILWLPLSSTPKNIGGKRMTPQLYIRQIGPLFSIDRPGELPLLAGKIATNRRGQFDKSKVSLSALRRGKSGTASKLVPLFVGLERVHIPDKLHVLEIAVSVSNLLPELYAKHLNVEYTKSGT